MCNMQYALNMQYAGSRHSMVTDTEVCVKATTIKCDQESEVPCASRPELHDHFLRHILVLGWTVPPGCHQTLIRPKSLLSPSSSY